MLVILSLTGLFGARETHAQTTAPAVATVTVLPDQKRGAIDPLFFGVNTLFMYDDKAALADDAFVKTLRDIPVHLMRFPGGDIGDNYFWDEHRLDDPTHWPRIDKPTSADTDAFMAFCQKVGGEALFVVNLESGFVHNDIDREVKRAADWVRYCNVEKKYNVKYWEIGNETFWYRPGKHKRIRITAAQYGDAFVKYAKAMTEVDPTIQIGAIGLVDPTSSVNNTLPDGSTATPAEPAWWPTVLKVASPHVDFVTVHSYPGSASQNYDAFIRRGAWGAETLPALRAFLDKTLPKHVPIALTEWNIDAQNPLEGMALAQIQANLLCHFIDEGVEMACIWPLRLPRGNTRSLLDFKTRRPQPMYKVFQMFSQNLAGTTRIASDCDDSTLFNFATVASDGSINVVLIRKSKSDQPAMVIIRCDQFKPSSAGGNALVAPALESTEVRTATLNVTTNPDASCRVEIPPFSIGLVKLRPAK